MALCKLDGIDAPAIYLGGLSAARDEAALRSHSITHVVDLTASGIDYEGFRHRGVRYLRVDLQDQPRADLATHLPRINDFVNMARKKHGAPVLLHCSSGTSRSAAAACAYLVEHCAMTMRRALDVCGSATKLCINVGFLRQLADFEVATMLYRIDRRVPAPPELTLKKEREQVRPTIDVTELAVDQLTLQYEDGFLCRGMPREVFTRELCRAALEERPITEAGLVDAMMCLEQQNRRRSNSVRQPDLAAYEKQRAEADERERRREQRELEASRRAASEALEDGSAAVQPSEQDRDLLAEDAEEKDEAISKLQQLKTLEDVDAQIEHDVAEMTTSALGAGVPPGQVRTFWTPARALGPRCILAARPAFCALHCTRTVAKGPSGQRDCAAANGDAAIQEAPGRTRCRADAAGGPPARGRGRKPDDGHDYDDATVGRDESEGAVSMADDAPVDDSDVAAVAMRRKVEREREAAAHAIQQRIRK